MQLDITQINGLIIDKNNNIESFKIGYLNLSKNKQQQSTKSNNDEKNKIFLEFSQENLNFINF